MKKIITVILAILVTASSICYYNLKPVNADSPTTISVTVYQQENTNWCWAACAKMVGKYYSGTAISQSNIVKYIKGVVVNEMATVTQTKNAATYASSGWKTFSIMSSGSVSFSTIQTKINAGKLMISACGVYSGGTRIGGHMMVLNGWNSGNANYVYFVNPQDGYSYARTYSAFINGMTIQGYTLKHEQIINAD